MHAFYTIKLNQLNSPVIDSYPSLFCLFLNQMGATIKEFLRLVEEFVSMIGMQMSGFQEIYETTENLGEPQFPLPASLCPSHVCSE